MDWSYASPFGKLIRLPLRVVPHAFKNRIWSGPLRGARWIGKAGVNGYWLGWYERPKANLFYRSIKPGDTVLDIGAHVGYYSLLAARATGSQGRVFAFEPLPRNLEFLRKHKELNRADNMEVVPAAAGDRTGPASFAAGPDTTSGWVGEGMAKVDMVDLDSFCGARGLRPAVVKIDVEGGGAAVLRGAAKVIAESKPRIFFALHNAEERAAAQKLAGEGYRLNFLEGKDLSAAGEILLEPGD